MRGVIAGAVGDPAPVRAMNARTLPVIEFRPAEGALMPCVESFYLYRHDAKQIDGVERVDLGQIRFMLKGEGYRTFADGHSEPSRAVMINGAGTAAATYHVDGPFHCFGVSLRAIGWKALIGLPAHALGNRIVDGVEVFGPECHALLERLRALDTLEAMIAEIEPFLLARRRPVPKSHLALARAAREWAASGATDVASFYAMVPMGERQATRLCNEYFGGPPKLLARKFRAIRAAMAIYQRGDPGEAADAFFDEPHMIREIRRFTGHTPTTLRERIDPVLAVTLDNETFHFLPDVIPEEVDPDGG